MKHLFFPTQPHLDTVFFNKLSCSRIYIYFHVPLLFRTTALIPSCILLPIHHYFLSPSSRC